MHGSITLSSLISILTRARTGISPQRLGFRTWVEVVESNHDIYFEERNSVLSIESLFFKICNLYVFFLAFRVIASDYHKKYWKFDNDLNAVTTNITVLLHNWIKSQTKKENFNFMDFIQYYRASYGKYFCLSLFGNNIKTHREFFNLTAQEYKFTYSEYDDVAYHVQKKLILR